ncbi:hypothetical protein CPB84DRAFT_1684296, partial [Gymnopilus junonius]
KSKWAVKQKATPGQYPVDDIQTYLKEDIIPYSSIQDASGYIQYWHKASKTWPHLAKMGLDYCSAPGKLSNHFSTV